MINRLTANCSFSNSKYQIGNEFLRILLCRPLPEICDVAPNNII